MIPQIRFALELYRRSGRWLAPLSLLLIWFMFAIANAPNSLDTLGALFPAFLFVACWIALSVGDVDDRSHREMTAAAAGSRRRLHLARAAASLTVGAAMALLQTLYISVVLDQPDLSTLVVIAVSLATLVAASALGVAIGCWLHDPLVTNRALSVGLGFALPAAILLLPPLQTALRRLGDGAIVPGATLAFVCLGIAAGAIPAAAAATERLFFRR